MDLGTVLDGGGAIARGHLAAAASAGSRAALLRNFFVWVMTSCCCLSWLGLVPEI